MSVFEYKTMNIAISIVIIISVFNFIFTYSVLKTVSLHNQIISILVKNNSLITKGYSILIERYLDSNTTTDTEDENE